MFDQTEQEVKPEAVTAAPVDPTELSDDDLDHHMQALWAHVHVAMGRAAALQAEISRRGLWHKWGARSAGHWLSWRAGLSMREANTLCRVADRLSECPGTKRALEAGEVSVAKAAAITRVANDATEDTLLQYARYAPTPELEAITRAYNKTTEALTDEDVERHHRRYLQAYFDEGSDYIIRGRLTPERDPTATRSSCTCPRTPCPRGCARSSRERRSHPRPPAASRATQRSWRWSKPAGRRCRVSRNAPCRPACAGRSRRATRRAGGPGARRAAATTPTTSCSGPTTARRFCPTSSFCAACTIGRYTRAGSSSLKTVTASGSSPPGAGRSPRCLKSNRPRAISKLRCRTSASPSTPIGPCRASSSARPTSTSRSIACCRTTGPPVDCTTGRPYRG